MKQYFKNLRNELDGIKNEYNVADDIINPPGPSTDTCGPALDEYLSDDPDECEMIDQFNEQIEELYADYLGMIHAGSGIWYRQYNQILPEGYEDAIRDTIMHEAPSIYERIW